MDVANTSAFTPKFNVLVICLIITQGVQYVNTFSQRIWGFWLQANSNINAAFIFLFGH